MPYVFTFSIHHNIKFRTALVSKRCSCLSSNGERCRIKSVIGSTFCWIHLLHQKHLRIKESNIANAGNGLFALWVKNPPEDGIIFREGDEIIRYHGEVINNAELNHRYGRYTAPYGIQINRNRFEDAARERGPGSLINHTANKTLANCRFAVSRNNRDRSLDDKIVVKATRNIMNGQEILVNYGNQYRFNERGVEYRTAYGKL